MDFSKTLTSEFVEGAIKFFGKAGDALLYLSATIFLVSLSALVIAYAQMRRAAAAERYNALYERRLTLELGPDARRPGG